ncbi:MAG: TonB-dependent receptor, partial [Deltaproteobacteria bacterium]|nr:TonB-dependent receptor [Deltaproteobacteria bacterium]
MRNTTALIAALLATPIALAGEADDLLLGEEPSEPVRAVALPVSLKPADSVVLTGEELLRRGYRTLGEALADVVGVEVQNSSRGRRYGMRGIPDGVALVIDGVPVWVAGERDRIDVDEAIDLADVERVEVARGPVSAINGVGALSGVVRVTTRRPGLTGGQLQIGTTHLGERDVRGAASLRHGALALRAALAHQQGVSGTWRLDRVPTRFIRIGRAIVPATKRDVEIAADEDTSTQGRLTAAAGELQLDASIARTDLHTPISSFSHALLDPGPQQRRLCERQRLRLAWQRALGPASVDLAVYTAHQLRTEVIALYPRGGLFPTGGSIELDGESATGGALLRADVSVARGHRLILGGFGDLTRDHTHTAAVDPMDGQRYSRLVELDELDATATATAEYQGDFGHGLHASAGAAVEWRTGYSAAVVPRAALVYLPLPALSLRLSYAEGSRAPDRYDLAALTQAVVAGRVEGAGDSSGLRPEHTRTGELAARYEPSPQLQAEVDAYLTRHEDAIEAQIVGDRLAPQNLPPRLVVGGEASASVEAWPRLLRFNAAGAVGRTVDGPVLENRLLTLLAGATVTPLAGLELGARGRVGLHEGRSTETSSSAVVDLFASYQLLDGALVVTAAARNLNGG